jgi:hypothetical protein
MRATTPVPNGAGEGIGTGALVVTLRLGTVPVGERGVGLTCGFVLVPCAVPDVAADWAPDVAPDVAPEVADGDGLDEDVQATTTAAKADAAAAMAAA